MMTKRHWLIAGGDGRAARTLRHALADDGGYRVTVLTRRPPAALLEQETSVILPDIFNPPGPVLAGVDVLVNFAGLVTGDAVQLAHVNVEGASRLAEAARQAGVGQFVHIGSLSVYGDAEDIDQDTPESPATPYGRSKRDGDRALLALMTSDFVVTTLRVPILYSAETAGKLNQLVGLAARLGILPAPAPRAPRSILSLSNLVKAILRVAEDRIRGIVFAADPQPFDLDLLAAAAADAGQRVRVLTLPAVLFGPLRKLAPRTYASLYGRSVIAPGTLLDWRDAAPSSTRSNVAELFG